MRSTDRDASVAILEPDLARTFQDQRHMRWSSQVWCELSMSKMMPTSPTWDLRWFEAEDLSTCAAALAKSAWAKAKALLDVLLSPRRHANRWGAPHSSCTTSCKLKFASV